MRCQPPQLMNRPYDTAVSLDFDVAPLYAAKFEELERERRERETWWKHATAAHKADWLEREHRIVAANRAMFRSVKG